MNPFDDEHSEFLVLRNDEDQYCIWPVFTEVPKGWYIAQERSPRAEALAFVQENWTDLRPASVRS